jgi:hypothetical protein
MFNAILIKLAKYFFLSFFLCMFFYAALLGREGIEKYHLGEPGSMLEEYLAVIALWVLIDFTKYLYAKLFRTQARH